MKSKNLATFVKLREGVSKLATSVEVSQKLKGLKGPPANPAAKYIPTPSNFRAGADLRNREITDPRLVISANNDYINMSKANILTSLNPDRPINARILK